MNGGPAPMFMLIQRFILVGGDSATRRKRKSLGNESRQSWKKRRSEEKMVNIEVIIVY